MCGIFGAIGKGADPNILRGLAIANRERGTDSLGFFDSRGQHVKTARDPMAALGKGAIAGFIANRKRWFIAGHTRYATQGKVIRENAHPFQYGRFIGCHNGIVSAPKTYAVDSMYLFDRLAAHCGDYQSAFADISGYWALAWFDGVSFYLQAHGNTIALAQDDSGTWYYSSDGAHLLAASGLRPAVHLHGGATIRFDVKSTEFAMLPDFHAMPSSDDGFYDRLARKCGYANLADVGRTEKLTRRGAADMLDKAAYDQEFREAFLEYAEFDFDDNYRPRNGADNGADNVPF